MGPTFDFKWDLVGLGNHNFITMVLFVESLGNSTKAIDIGEWSICGGDRLERLHFSCKLQVIINISTISLFCQNIVAEGGGKRRGPILKPNDQMSNVET